MDPAQEISWRKKDSRRFRLQQSKQLIFFLLFGFFGSWRGVLYRRPTRKYIEMIIDALFKNRYHSFLFMHGCRFNKEISAVVTGLGQQERIRSFFVIASDESE